MEIAGLVIKAIKKESIPPVTNGKYRMGDIRHCYADISKAKEQLGFKPAITLKAGLDELNGWLHGQIAKDDVDKATEELSKRGLTI